MLGREKMRYKYSKNTGKKKFYARGRAHASERMCVGARAADKKYTSEDSTRKKGYTQAV